MQDTRGSTKGNAGAILGEYLENTMGHTQKILRNIEQYWGNTTLGECSKE